jgi:deoxycytidylate deaminase
MNFERLLSLAVEEAKKSTHKHLVGCVVFQKGRIISKGHNYPQKSIKHFKGIYQRYPQSVHAEVSAIINAKTDLVGTSLLVVRINKKNQFMMSKPCEHCQMYLEYVGIKKYWYSISEYPYIIMEKV